MSDLPTGTITFLFTDIEGSTTRWEQQTQAMQAALARHDAILRDAIKIHGGTIFKTVGDAFYAVFTSAPDALHASLAVQRALQSDTWDDALGSLRVRVALHTGTPEARGSDYFGPPLNRVARLLSAGHGAQILLSAATQELVRDVLPPTVTLADLGEHRLKDLVRPERIFQVVVPDLPISFPALRTLDARPHNLPIQRELLIGREHEVADLTALLRKGETGLVILTGPGGIGKTRLSLQVAAEVLDYFADGVWFVDLAPLSDPDLLAATIAYTVGTKEVHGQSVADALKAYVRDKRMLLVLDNFEQILSAASLVADLLRVAPHLKILVTSREVLRLYNEREYPVASLALPDLTRLPGLERLTQYAAVTLFIQRAQMARSDFQVTNATAPAVAEICVRLDGLPLAIELAAARVKLLTPHALLARLDNRLQFLTGGARDRTARQQTLRGAIDWSYNLLDAAEQILLARLAVFVGGCTLEAAEAIVTNDGFGGDVLDGLQSLVEKSLLIADLASPPSIVGSQDDGQPRFGMFESIRDYALERLETSGEATATRQLHTAFFIDMAAQASPELTGPRQADWLARLAREHANMRAVLERLLHAGSAIPDTRRGLRLAAMLWRYWRARGHLSEGRRWLQLALDREHDIDAEADAGRVASVLQALYGAGYLAQSQGDYVTATASFDRCLMLARTAGDRRSAALALQGLGSVADFQGDYSRAAQLFEETLVIFRDLGDARGTAVALDRLAGLALNDGAFERAGQFYEESLGLWRQGGSPEDLAVALNNIGHAELSQGAYRRAIPPLEESLSLSRELGDVEGMAYAASNLAAAWLDAGDTVQAAVLLRESVVRFDDLNDTLNVAHCLEIGAGIAAVDQETSIAARLFGAAEALREVIGAPREPAEAVSYARYLNVARAQMDEEAFARDWEAGRSVPRERLLDQLLRPTTD